MKNPQKHSTKIRTTIWTDACAKTKMPLWSVILWPLSTVTKHFNRNNHVPGGIVFMVCYVVSTFDESELRSNDNTRRKCDQMESFSCSVMLCPLSTNPNYIQMKNWRAKWFKITRGESGINRHEKPKTFDKNPYNTLNTCVRKYKNVFMIHFLR